MATSVVGSILAGGTGPVLDGIAHIINSVKGKNPEDAARLQELLSKHEDTVISANLAVIQTQSQENVQLNQIAGENVRADASSGDHYTSRARPSIIYVGLGILVFNFCVLAFLTKWGWKPTDLPSMFWEAWTIVSTGVVFTRTADKTLGGAGGSIKLPFGVQLQSNGD